MMNEERKLVTVRRIAAIDPIPGADAIDVATVDGWKVVVKKGDFEVGRLAAYFEVDSWVPELLAPFLFKGREYNGVKGERLRTIKLRGQISQGLLLPIPEFSTIPYTEGGDLTEMLGVQKWEKAIPVQMQGQMRGSLPSFIRKTDQERVQNCFRDIDLDAEYEATIKLDGSSMTVWFKDGEMGVCSRNIDLKMDQEGNTFVDLAKRIFTDSIKQVTDLAFQGELMGPNVQGNRENLKEHEFFVFNVWSIGKQEYYPPAEARQLCKWMGLTYVPVLYSAKKIDCASVDDFLALADKTKSLYHPISEGIVFKRMDGRFSFKVISNKYLLKEAA